MSNCHLGQLSLATAKSDLHSLTNLFNSEQKIDSRYPLSCTDCQPSLQLPLDIPVLPTYPTYTSHQQAEVSTGVTVTLFPYINPD